MTKKAYMKPAMTVEELGLDIQILAVSLDAYGMNKSLQDEEVDEAWSRGGSVWDEE